MENIRTVWHMKTWYSSKCPNTPYTTDFAGPKCLNSFYEWCIYIDVYYIYIIYICIYVYIYIGKDKNSLAKKTVHIDMMIF